MRNSATDFPPSEREGDSIIEEKIQIEQEDAAMKNRKKNAEGPVFS